MVVSNGEKVLLSFAEFSTRILIATLIVAVSSVAHANDIDPPPLVYKNQRYVVESETIRVVTAYNAGDPAQTDDSPCISASGEDLCAALELGQKRCAANFVH